MLRSPSAPASAPDSSSAAPSRRCGKRKGGGYLLLVLLALPVEARAQEAAAPLAVTYGALLREYGAYRRVPPPPATADTTDNPDAGIVQLEIDGLVVDLTMTKLGRDFYDAFYRMWRAPAGAFNFTVTIQEQPVPGNGTGVTVLVDDEITFQTRLQPREEVIEGAAQQAVGYAYRRLQTRDSALPTY